MDVKIATLGQNKGTQRVWLEGQMLLRCGFSPKTRYQIKTENGSLILYKEEIGFRIVSSRTRADKEIPIIDINSRELLAMFDGLEQVRVIFKDNEIHILPLASELHARERLERVKAKMASNTPLSFGSLAHGGGVMDDAMEAGFTLEGVPSHLAFANEIRSDLTEHAISLKRTWTDKTIGLNMPMQELAFDEYVVKKLGYCDILSVGQPCSGASVAGRVKRGLVHAEAHPEVGHLVVAFLAIVVRVQPIAISLECVVPYFSSASMDIIRTQLNDMHYDVHETTVEGADWNVLEHRRRMVMIATTKGMPFSFSDLVKPELATQLLSSILEDIALDDPRWSLMSGLKEKEKRDAAANKSFAMQIFTGASTKIGTLTKGISKRRSTDPMIQNSVNPELLRTTTPIEHARAKGVCPTMIEGLSATIAHEMLGQSVIYPIFVSVGQTLAKAFKAMNQIHAEPEFQLACG